MPEMRRLIPAVVLALAAWLAADTYVTHLPENTIVGSLRLVCAIIGALVGWLVVGRRIGVSYRASIEAGVLGAVSVLFWALVSFSVYEMIDRAIQLRYKQGLGQAITDLFNILLEFGLSLAKPDVLVILFVGAILGAFCGQWASGRWK